MTAAVQSNIATPTLDLSGVEFATSADALALARIGDLILAMVTAPPAFPTSQARWLFVGRWRC